MYCYNWIDGYYDEYIAELNCRLDIWWPFTHTHTCIYIVLNVRDNHQIDALQTLLDSRVHINSRLIQEHGYDSMFCLPLDKCKLTIPIRYVCNILSIQILSDSKQQKTDQQHASHQHDNAEPLFAIEYWKIWKGYQINSTTTTFFGSGLANDHPSHNLEFILTQQVVQGLYYLLREINRNHPPKSTNFKDSL